MRAGDHRPRRPSGHGPRRGRPPSISISAFAAPMGLAPSPRMTGLRCLDAGWKSRDVPAVTAEVDPLGGHETCFLGHVTATSGSAIWLEEVTISGSTTLACRAFAPWRSLALRGHDT